MLVSQKNSCPSRSHVCRLNVHLPLLKSNAWRLLCICTCYIWLDMGLKINFDPIKAKQFSCVCFLAFYHKKCEGPKFICHSWPGVKMVQLGTSGLLESKGHELLFLTNPNHLLALFHKISLTLLNLVLYVSFNLRLPKLRLLNILYHSICALVTLEP